MKKIALLFPIVGAFAYLTLSSSSGGRPGNLTASGCGSCHGSSAVAGITVAFELDSAGVPVTKYKPGMAYTIKMTGTNTTTFTLPKFGFHLVSVMGSGTTQAGTWGSFPTGTSTHTSSGLSVLGQTTPLASAGSGATGSTYVVSVGWTAPVAGSGTVTLKAVLNAVNGNTNDDNGDKWNTASATFGEWPANTTSITESTNVSVISAYPNPVIDIISFDLGNNTESIISVFDMSGKLMATTKTSDMHTSINTSNLPVGIYQATILQNGKLKTVSFSKQ